MNSWKQDSAGRKARANATRAFCEHMENLSEAERSIYTAVPPTPDGLRRARELFARLGDFQLEENGPIPNIEPIPTTTVFRVYEPDNRDDLVTIVLPPKGDLPPVTLFAARDYYRCTYWPYIAGEVGGPKDDEPTAEAKE
jgi:hypothetical protein